MKQPEIAPNDVCSTGSAALDAALGTGGVPRGRITEIFGAPGTGKHLLALSVLTQAQAAGSVCAYIDTQRLLDLRKCRDLGVDCGRLLSSQPDSPDQALDVIEALARSGEVGLIVVDDTSALISLRGTDDGEGFDGLSARLMSLRVRKLASLAHQTGTTPLFCTPTAPRQPHGVASNVPKFYASVRMHTRLMSARPACQRDRGRGQNKVAGEVVHA